MTEKTVLHYDSVDLAERALSGLLDSWGDLSGIRKKYGRLVIEAELGDSQLGCEFEDIDHSDAAMRSKGKRVSIFAC